jgi:hypothetical protein
MVQAIDRLRLIHTEKRKTVYMCFSTEPGPHPERRQLTAPPNLEPRDDIWPTEPRAPSQRVC